MSKMNAFRIINLNYNYNTIRVDDELWDFHGESTLLSLRNGGGKSVLVQMLTAPFVHKKYRSTKERPFASYFTTNKPTFLLIEWQLDDQAGYVLTGMMVRQHQAMADEESADDALDLVNFIYEYQTANAYDIRNFPVVSQEDNGRKLKGYKACLDLFDAWKNDQQMKFFAYDMNSQRQAHAYFNKLEEYQIYHTEWEEIIHKINEQESGLADLFIEAKNERKLIEKWFLDSVEKKLNKTEDRIKSFRHLMLQYIQQYKENQFKIEKQVRIEQFAGEIVPAKTTAEHFLHTIAQKQQAENQIAHFMQEVTTEKQQAEHNLQDIECELQQVREQIFSVQYDQHSWKIYQLEDQRLEKMQQKEAFAEQQVQQKQDLQNIERQANILECARRYLEWQEASHDVQKAENKLDLLHQDQAALEPEREQLGYTLRYRYQQKLEEQQKIMEHTVQRIQEVKTEQQELQSSAKQQQQQHKRVYGEMAKVRERIRQYDIQEKDFNTQFQQQLTRNLLGEYEVGTLELLSKEQEQIFDSLRQQVTVLARQREELHQQKHLSEREQNDNREQLGKLSAELANQEKQMAQLQQELTERATLAEHVGVSNDQLLDTPVLLAAFQKRLDDLQETLRILRNQQEEEEQKYRRLKNGQLLEVPAAFIEALHDLGIHFVFGMEWLKQNGYTQEANQAVVDANPFVPYSLIMSQKDFQRLQNSALAVATTFPVPIVLREALDRTGAEQRTVLSLNEQIGFYVWFDQRLLDPLALEQLLDAQKAMIDKLHEQQEQRQQEFGFYQEKLDLLKGQHVNRQVYNETQKTIETLQAAKRLAEQEGHQFRDQIEQLSHKLDGLEVKQRQTDLQLHKQEQLVQKLGELCTAYMQYQENKKLLEKLQEETVRLERIQLEQEQRQQELELLRQSLLDGKREQQGQIQVLQQQFSRFLHYTEQPIIVKDMDDLLSRYEALTQKVSESQKMIEEQLQNAKERFQRIEEDLLHYSKQCDLVTDDYQLVQYDKYVADELQSERKQLQQKMQQLQEQLNVCSGDIRVLETKIESQLADLQKQLGEQQVRARDKIIVVDFEQVLVEYHNQKAQLEKSVKEVLTRIQLYQNNLDSMTEFAEMPITAPLTEKINFAILGRKELDELRGKMIRDYRALCEQERDVKETLYKQTDQLCQQPDYQDDFFKLPLKSLASLTDEPNDYMVQLQTTLDSYKKMLEKLSVDIAILEREKGKIQEMFFSYLTEIHRQMASIDKNSTIRIRERTLKMLRISLPDWEKNEELYQAKLRQYLSDVTQQCIVLLEENQNVEENLGTRITTKELYDTVVGISNIEVKLYKIEERQEYQIPWSDVAKNSGGEGFLSAFIVLSSLLSFMRHQDTDLFGEREESKVLLMDNPFAKANAAHLLIPMMEMAKRTNTQLICLSGLGGDSIYSRFENIYVLTLVDSGLNRGVEYLRGEHVKGLETKPQSIISAQIQIEDMEQIELF